MPPPGAVWPAMVRLLPAIARLGLQLDRAGHPEDDGAVRAGDALAEGAGAGVVEVVTS